MRAMAKKGSEGDQNELASTSGASEMGPAELAGAFAEHFEHLRRYRGVDYLRGDAIEIEGHHADVPSDQGSVAAESVEPPKMKPGANERADVRKPEPAPQPAVPKREASRVPVAPQPQAPSSVGASAGRIAPAKKESVEEIQRRVLQAQAREWPAAKKLQYLRQKNIGDCRRCALARTRRNLVFGVGNPEASLMFVGEAPGAEEDAKGEPFVGAAGRRLNEWLETVGMKREEVFIANVLKCRPPGNRDPKPEEIEKCSPFLLAQIRAIQPRVLVALGRFAGCKLLGKSMRMYQMRGVIHEYAQPDAKSATPLRIPLIVTYHPSYVLRQERGEGRGGPNNRRDGKSENQLVVNDLERALSFLKD